MSEKIAYVISALLFMVLVVLILLERQNPEGGVLLLQELLH